MTAESRGKPRLRELLRASERIGFLYLDYCAVHVSGDQLLATADGGSVPIPTGRLGTLWLGTSVSVTHQAVMKLAQFGVSLMWVGEQGLAFYAHGRPLSGSTDLLRTQAAVHLSPRRRLAVAREMYRMRFQEAPPASATSLARLRGAEGVRVRNLYRRCAEVEGVRWDGRQFTPGDFGGSDPINQALTVAHHCMYAIALGVINALGMSPALGIVHNGAPESFVYDIADLYKADLCIPTAFRVASRNPQSTGRRLASLVRADMRAQGTAFRLVPHMVADIHQLFGISPVASPAHEAQDRLWSPGGDVASGVDYSTDVEGE